MKPGRMSRTRPGFTASIGNECMLTDGEKRTILEAALDMVK